jgi:hypothetical protein
VSESIPQIRLKWNQVSGWKGLLSNADFLLLLFWARQTLQEMLGLQPSIKSQADNPSSRRAASFVVDA